MPLLGLFVLAFGTLLLTCCAMGLGHVNPGQRLPGRLPGVVHNRRLRR